MIPPRPKLSAFDGVEVREAAQEVVPGEAPEAGDAIGAVTGITGVAPVEAPGG